MIVILSSIMIIPDTWVAESAWHLNKLKMYATDYNYRCMQLNIKINQWKRGHRFVREYKRVWKRWHGKPLFIGKERENDVIAF